MRMFNFDRLEKLAVILADRIVAAILIHNYFDNRDGYGSRANTYKEMLKELKK